MEEIWKDIKGYEGYYQISNFGRVRSLNRYVTTSNNRKIFLKGKNMSLRKHYKGYIEIKLAINNTFKIYKIHRLVAEAFIPNPHNYMEVNHKDEMKTNNIVSNLEWCDRKYNVNYGTGIERRSKSISSKTKGVPKPYLRGNLSPRAKKIKQIDLKTNEVIKIWDCIKYAAEYFNGNTIKGKHKHAYGYKWQYVN